MRYVRKAKNGRKIVAGKPKRNIDAGVGERIILNEVLEK